VISPAQTNALQHVRTRAEAARAGVRAKIHDILERSGLGQPDYEAIVRFFREDARVTLNFHPDRPVTDGLTVAEKLLSDGLYRSQFVTRISNGGRTAFAGGDRDIWERTLFGGAYQVPGVNDDERPKYGGLDVMQHAEGACPRFGSCYFDLRPHMVSRCTFTWGDTFALAQAGVLAGSEQVGTIDAFDPVLAALFESVEMTGEALGATGLDVRSLANLLTSAEHTRRRDPAERSVRRALDTYIEAQVHSDIDLSRDVEALVIDPAFDGTTTGEQLRGLCAKHGITLQSHPGFVLAASEVPPDFRGPRMVPLAARLSERFAQARGELDAAVIGCAAQSLHRDPAAWRDWGTFEETLQELKQMWHVLVRYGHARARR
jgi:hypothetical protein